MGAGDDEEEGEEDDAWHSSASRLVRYLPSEVLFRCHALCTEEVLWEDGKIGLDSYDEDDEEVGGGGRVRGGDEEEEGKKEWEEKGKKKRRSGRRKMRSEQGLREEGKKE